MAHVPCRVCRFESHFKFDENRIPREWDKDADIPAIYLESRQNVCLWAAFRLSCSCSYDVFLQP